MLLSWFDRDTAGSPFCYQETGFDPTTTIRHTSTHNLSNHHRSDEDDDTPPHLYNFYAALSHAKLQLRTKANWIISFHHQHGNGDQNGCPY